MRKKIIKSFCKINLSLRVVKKLRINYHSINSVITSCNIYDVISIEKIYGSKDILTFSGKFKKGIKKNNNTIFKLLCLLRLKKPFKGMAFKINIEKNIPHGSGLGGGSTNAASLLNYFASKKRFNIKRKEKIKIASQVGFDVPISLERKNSIIFGKNNNLKRIDKKFRLNILIIYPNIKCSTKLIYKKNKNFSFLDTKHNINSLNKKNFIDFLKNERNDLENKVIELYPQIGKIINFIRLQNGCYFSRITGSGSACIGIFFNASAANSAKKLAKLKFPKCWAVTSKTI